MTESQVYVTCDVCGTWWARTCTQSVAREALREEGWTFGKLVKCPDCKEKKSE